MKRFVYVYGRLMWHAVLPIWVISHMCFDFGEWYYRFIALWLGFNLGCLVTVAVRPKPRKRTHWHPEEFGGGIFGLALARAGNNPGQPVFIEMDEDGRIDFRNGEQDEDKTD